MEDSTAVVDFGVDAYGHLDIRVLPVKLRRFQRHRRNRSFPAPWTYGKLPVRSGTAGRRYGKETAPQVGFQRLGVKACRGRLGFRMNSAIRLRAVCSRLRKAAMPIQPLLVRPRQVRSAQRFASRVTCPTVGQCFDIEVTRDADGWMIHIPEIGRTTRAIRRAAVDMVARGMHLDVDRYSDRLRRESRRQRDRLAVATSLICRGVSRV